MPLITSPIPDSILNRKGSPTAAGVPAKVRCRLSAGEMESVNLSESLVADQAESVLVVGEQHNWPGLRLRITAALEAIHKPMALRRRDAIAGVPPAEFSAST